MSGVAVDPRRRANGATGQITTVASPPTSSTASSSSSSSSSSLPPSASSPSASTSSSDPSPSASTPTEPRKQGTKRKQPIPTVSMLRNELAIALVCQSNLNRSMEAQWVLQERGNVRSYSFGAGSKVRLPGETIDRPHVYEFGTSYDTIYKDLERKNRNRYAKNGMLQMLDRNRQLKEAPERWQDHYEIYLNDESVKKRQKKDLELAIEANPLLAFEDHTPKPKHFDIVITFEKRVYDIVQSDIEGRGQNSSFSNNLPTHLINIDTTDNHAEAAVSANLTLELIENIYQHVKQRKRSDVDEVEEEKESAQSALSALTSTTSSAAVSAKPFGQKSESPDQPESEAEQEVDGGDEWVEKMDDVIDEFEKRYGKEVFHHVLFY